MISRVKASRGATSTIIAWMQAAGDARQSGGVDRAEGLGNDFGGDQHGGHQAGRKNADGPLVVAQHLGRLGAGEGGAGGVGDGVQGEDGGNRVVDPLLLELEQDAGADVAFAAAVLELADRAREKHGFAKRTHEGDRQGEKYCDDEKGHEGVLDEAAVVYSEKSRAARRC